MTDQIIRLNKINIDEIKSITADERTDWLNQILDELMEDLQGHHQDCSKRSIVLNAELEIREDDQYKKLILLEGQVKVCFSAVCSKTSELIDQKLDISLKTILLNKMAQINHDLGERISLLYKNEEWDLYFYEKNQVDLYPIIHEYIFLNKNPYPGLE